MKQLQKLQPIITPTSLARIIGWTVFFLILAHFATPKVPVSLPYAKEMKEQSLTPLMTATADPRWARQDMNPLPPDSMVWIGGSSYAIKNDDGSYRFLPGEVAPKLEHQYNHYVSIKMARRLLDTYNMVLDAIERQPAAMVVTLNPFWELNDRALFFKTNLMNDSLSHWNNQEDWAFIPLLNSPGSFLWQGVGQHHNVIGNGYDILKSAQPNKTAKKQVQKANNKKKFSYNQPALFWLTHGDVVLNDHQNFDAGQWQEEIMFYNDPLESQMAIDILRRMFNAIEQSNIPTMVYVAPVSITLEKTNIAYPEIFNAFRQLRMEHPNVRIIPHFAMKAYRGMEFIDHLHLKNAGIFPDFIASNLDATIKKHKQKETK